MAIQVNLCSIVSQPTHRRAALGALGADADHQRASFEWRMRATWIRFP